MNLIGINDELLRDIKYVRPSYSAVLAEGMVLTNQAAFWRRRLHGVVGYLDESLDCGFDLEWFLRCLDGRRASHVNEVWGALRLHEDTKTSNLPAVFNDEYRRVLKGRESSAFAKRFFQIRRLALMLAQGHIRYIIRGLFRRSRFR